MHAFSGAKLYLDNNLTPLKLLTSLFVRWAYIYDIFRFRTKENAFKDYLITKVFKETNYYKFFLSFDIFDIN